MRKKKINKDSNELGMKLEAGESIKGLVGFIRMHEEEGYERTNVFVKVRCIGLTTAECGVSVLVEPVSGDGQFKITPCQWYDSPQKVAEQREQDEALVKVLADVRQILSSYYAHGRRRLLEEYANQHLTVEQLADFEADVKEKGGISKLDQSRVKELAFTLASIKHGYKKPVEAANDYYS